VPTDHENADELLVRDIENIVGYFQRKYPGTVGDLDTDGLAESIRTGSFDSSKPFLE